MSAVDGLKRTGAGNAVGGKLREREVEAWAWARALERQGRPEPAWSRCQRELRDVAGALSRAGLEPRERSWT